MQSSEYKSYKLSTEEITMLQKLLSEGLSSRKVAAALGNKVTKSTVNNIRNTIGVRPQQRSPKILCIDIETTPELSYNWGRWKQFISQGQVVEQPYILTWAAKWIGSDTIYSDKLTNYEGFFKGSIKDDRDITLSLVNIINEADMVIAHNGDKFDIPWLIARIIYHNLLPLNPNKFYDTLKVAKKLIRVPSYSLESLCVYYGLPRKLDNDGFPLWRRCLEGDPEAFDEMETYNRGDIKSLEALYLKLSPYDRAHPNLTLTGSNNSLQCHVCGSEDMNETGTFHRTNVSVFPVYQCGNCGAQQRSRRNIKTKEQMANVLMPC